VDRYGTPNDAQRDLRVHPGRGRWDEFENSPRGVNPIKIVILSAAKNPIGCSQAISVAKIALDSSLRSE